MSIRERLVTLVEPVVEAMGYELVLLEFNPHRSSASLRLFIDAPGGITLGDCERVSREIEGTLDVEDPIPQGYRLEVSSPGLDRPLIKPRHFERFAGSRIAVQLLKPREGGRRKFKGVLRGLKEETVMMEADDVGPVEFALGEIERARLEPDYAKELSGS
jgi:ribosome maturation factor RimP